MKVRMMVECITKLLNKTDGPNLRIRGIWTTGDKPFANLAYNDPENTLKNFMSLEVVANPHGEADNELPER